MKKILSFLWILYLILFISVLVLFCLKWNVFYWYVLPFSAALLTAAGNLVNIRQEADEKTGKERRNHCIKRAAGTLLVLALGLALSYDSARRSPSPVGFFHSADGRHELVVMKYDYLGVFYSAVPSMYQIFYKNRKKDIVFSYDAEPASDIQVRWLDNETAKVHIIYGSSVGTVEQDTILVSFAEQ